MTTSTTRKNQPTSASAMPAVNNASKTPVLTGGLIIFTLFVAAGGFGWNLARHGAMSALGLAVLVGVLAALGLIVGIRSWFRRRASR